MPRARFAYGKQLPWLRDGANQVSEWNYSGVGFDGFWRSNCTAVEAKAEYQQFFDEIGRPKWPFVREKVVRGWALQKDRQKNVIINARDPAKLQWHFKYYSCWLAANQAFGADKIICHHTP
ncbi:Tox-REase-5 domain-containing protein [Xanthomonas oryzae]|uniref:Tox-REase-5 domain-containing protein n=1 Tax=Xanthomonas oryzae TaxID=347 RepID=UPI001FB7F2B5|nr:Tox-REase-5 domain-containing protein [Xanthomonas oryzae]